METDLNIEIEWSNTRSCIDDSSNEGIRNKEHTHKRVYGRQLVAYKMTKFMNKI